MYIIIRNERSQARMMNCVMWSWSMIRVWSPLLVYHSYLYVAQQSHQHEDTCEIEMLGVEMLYHLRTYRVHDVAHKRYRGSDGDGLVDEGKVVAARILAWRLARLLHSQHIVASLGKTHEERDEESHQHNPLAQSNIGGHTACQEAKHKAEGNDADVDDGVLL